ncbi:MAG: hypothetical protein WBA10_21490 [Elainellaceae cyanobacterium]
MIVANAMEYQAATEPADIVQPLQPTTGAAVTAATAVSGVATIMATERYRPSVQPTLRSAPLWGMWGKALQRTRQLLWMLTRPERMLRSGTLALI